jgi:hypothetical protein
MSRGKPHKAFSYKGAPNVWDNRDEGSKRGYFTDPDTWAKPRVMGGVWQYDMFKDPRPATECSSSNPSDPNTCEAGPFQNATMNALFLILALRMGQHGVRTAEAIANEIEFLKTWFDHDVEHAGEDGLLMRFPPELLVLVRDRVPTYAYCEARKEYPAVYGYEPRGAWCGDQGLMLGGLLDYLSVHPSDPMPQPRAISIVGGVLRHMVTDQVVQSTLNFHEDLIDLMCGSGVFWRYLLQGFRLNGVLRKQVLAWVNEAPDNNPVYRSAQYACTHTDSRDPLFAEFNILATLTAAIEILRAAEA